MGELSFLAPIAGLIAGSIGSVLVVLFWMLKLRRKPVRVSSTLLWQRSVRDLEGNIPWQRVRPSWLLFLQLLAVVLLSLAIARPVRDAGLGGAGIAGEVAVIIDTSASMNTIIDERGRTRLDQAKDDAVDLIRTISARSSTTRFRVVRAGVVPQMITSGAGSWRESRAAINAIEGTDASSDLDGAIQLVEAMRLESVSEDETETDGVHAFVFTDAPIEEIGSSRGGSVSIRRPIPETSEPVFFGNLGIVLSAGQRDQTDRDQCRVFVTIAGVIDGKVGVRVEARVGDRVLVRRAIELDPDETGEVEAATTLAFRLESAELVEISIMRDDALASDNHAWISMPDPSPIVTTIIARDGVADPLLVDAMRAVTDGVVHVSDVGEPVASGTGILVYDRVARDPRVLIPSIEVGAGDRASGATTGLLRVLSWDRGHPVMRDVDLGGLRFSSFRRVEGTALATTRDGAVIAEQARDGIRHLLIGFAVEDSNWGVQVSMPIFLTNAVRYLLPGTSGSGIVYHTGEAIGEQRRVYEQSGVIELDGQRIGVSLLDREQSVRAGRMMDPAGRDGFSGGNSSGIMGAASGRVELWRWCVLAALVVLTLEWTLDMARRHLI